MKLLMLKGLPGSGKSTFAKELLKNPNWIRVNKDLLREMLNNSIHSKSNESYVNEVWEYIIYTSLLSGKNVVVDDTNLNPRHEKRLNELVRELKLVCDALENLIFEVKEFNVPVSECILRDKSRDKSVGEDVIKRLNKRYYESSTSNTM